MSDLKPTQRQVNLYNRIRNIAKPHHMYLDQLMAIAQWVDAEFTHKNKTKDENKDNQ